MAKPTRPTSEVFKREDRISAVEFLPNPNVLPDYMLNLAQAALRAGLEDVWDNIVGVLRLEGLKKTFRTAAEGTPATGKLNVIAPGLIADGEWFELFDGATRKRFEYDKNSSVAGGNVAIDISTAETVEDVREATETAINGAAIGITAEPTRRSSPAAGSVGLGCEIDLINDDPEPTIAGSAAQSEQGTNPSDPKATIYDNVRDERSTHVGMRSSGPIYATGRLEVPAPSALVDGQIFTIPGNSGPDAVFELDSNSSVTAGRVAVDLTGITTDKQLRDRVVTAINTKTADTDVTAAPVDIPATGYITALDPSEHVDGETLTLDDGTTEVTFEIDKAGNGVQPGNVAVNISAAADMQDVRAAWITAISGAAVGIDAFNRGFGARITLTNTLGNASAGNTVISDSISSPSFEVGQMTGGAAGVALTTTVAGSAMNRAITSNVASELFTVDGLSGGIDAGWDVTPGHCAFKAFDVVLSKIVRPAAIAGKQNFLIVRLRERLLDEDTDPDIVAVTAPGILQPHPGPNQYRWTPEVVIEAADAPAPVLQGTEVRIVDGILAEFDAVDGETLVDEVEVRGTKFGRFLEPQDVAGKLSINAAEQITGNLRPDGNGTRSLGTSSLRWDAFLDALDVAQIISSLIPDTNGARALGSSSLRWDAFIDELVAAAVASDLLPSGSRSLGSSGSRWVSGFFQGLNANGTTTLVGLNSSGDIMPDASGTRALGSSSFRWDAFIDALSVLSFVTNLVPNVNGALSVGTSSLRWDAFLDALDVAQVVSSLIPDTNGTRALGDATHRWDAFLDALDVGAAIAVGASLLGTGANARTPRFTLPLAESGVSTYTLFDEFYSASGEKIRVYAAIIGGLKARIVTVNASWNGSAWAKDVSGAEARYYDLGGSFSSAFYRAAGSDTPWTSWSTIVAEDSTGINVGKPLVMAGARLHTEQGSNLTVASTLTLGAGNFFDVASGSGTINHITTTDWHAGAVVILTFSVSCTVANNAGSPPANTAPILLAGGSNFSATANDTLMLVYDGANWLEVSRSVN